MNKKFRIAIICIAMITFVFMCLSAYAAECTITQTSDTEMTVKVKSSTDRISISVYSEGKSYADMLASDKTNYNDVMVYGNEFAVESGVEKTFVMDLKNCRTGAYTLVLSERGKTSKFGFNFERKDLKREALSQLHDEDDVDIIVGILDDYSNEVGISEADWDKADKEAAALYIVNGGIELKEEDKATDDLIKSAGTVGLLASGNIDNIYSKISYFGLGDTDLDGWYNADFVDENVQKDITEMLKDEKIDDSDDFYDAFLDSYILAVVENSDSYVNVKKVMEEFGSDAGISLGKMTVKDYAQLAGEKFSSISALENKIDALTGSGSGSNRPSGGGSGGGGGGSSGGGGGSGILRADEIETEVAEKLDVDIFSDLEDVEWARASIVALAEKSVINGKGDGLFFPNDNVTRYEFAKIAVLTFVPDGEQAELAFTDVPKEHWAYEYVGRAYAAGLINGRDESTFDGDGYITREEVAAILVRAATANGIAISDYEDAKNYVFRDDDMIDDYAREAVYILKHDGVINGVEADVFAPDENATRAQAAHMIYNLSQL